MNMNIPCIKPCRVLFKQIGKNMIYETTVIKSDRVQKANFGTDEYVNKNSISMETYSKCHRSSESCSLCRAWGSCLHQYTPVPH